MRVLLRKGRLIDPASGKDGIADILIEDGIIKEISSQIDVVADRVIEAEKKVILPAMVDMHVHLRQPGREDKETVKSASMAALKGGVGCVLAMPNTQPCVDSSAVVRELKEVIKQDALINIYICAAITKDRLGKELVDFAALKEAGVIAVSDDGNSLDDMQLLEQALLLAHQNKLTLIQHCEDKQLSAGGVVNLGFVSTRLGLRGISPESEYLRVERDLKIAEKLNVPIHITHVSCSQSVDLIFEAKRKGVPVTADTCPHYFCFDESYVSGYDANYKMNPPLRRASDVKAIKEGLRSGIIDAIASDHAPHTHHEKEVEFEKAEFGVIGLQTSISAAITFLINEGILDWLALARCLAFNPAHILGLNEASIQIGREARLIVVDPQKEWRVDKDTLLSKSKNSPFLEMRLKGVVEHTILQNKIYSFI